jgi:glycosyltransferase involved in cell wall biosynthesis
MDLDKSLSIPEKPNHPSATEATENSVLQTQCPLCGAVVGKRISPEPEKVIQWLGPWAARRLGFFSLPKDFLLSVVIPVYNERPTIDQLLRRVQAVPIPKEVLVVDDGSTDGTREYLAGLPPQENFRVFFHPMNLGKGAALRTAFNQAKGQVVLIQDADLEYDPAEYPRLIQPIVEGVADVVYGSRFASDGPHRVLYFWHYVANKCITTLSNMLTDLNLTDVETCYKAFRREVIHQIAPTLKERGFGIELELTAKVARRRCRIYEVGISYFGRTYQEGKKIGLRDALHALWCILRYAVAD